jgi:hypothetical protein
MDEILEGYPEEELVSDSITVLKIDDELFPKYKKFFLEKKKQPEI